LATTPALGQALAPAVGPGSSAPGAQVAQRPQAPALGPGARAAPEETAARAHAEATAAAPAAQNPGWSPHDIQAAQARCAALLKGLEVVAIPEVPLREGNACGTPAPMRLISVGKAPQVAFSPPPTLTCDMIAALHTWMQRDVQPLARKLLAAPVIRIETMSSYSCRNAYGRLHGRLSEHGRANAVDLASFVTAAGHTALVVSDWGPTAREIAAAAKAAAGVASAGAEPAAGGGPKTNTATAVVPGGPKASGPAGAASAPLSLSLPGVMVTIGGGAEATGRAFAPANRLGGPKARSAAHGAVGDARLDFLRAVHAAACRRFGTVLGPEANTTHKNHFHIDMADRPRGAICE
jgi:hypothetical protein